MPTTNELQTQIAALEAELVNAATLLQMSHDLGAARDADELLQAIAHPGWKSGAIGVSLFHIDLGKNGEPEWIEMVAERRQGELPSSPAGARIYLPDIPLSQVWMSSPDVPLLVGDVATDARVDESAKALLDQGSVRALANIPLTVGGRWVGLVVFTWDELHEFGEKETAIYNALPAMVSPVVENQRLLQQQELTIRDIAMFKAMVENSRDAILMTGMDDAAGPPQITYANHACYQMFGYDYESQEMLGQPGLVTWLEEDLPKFEQTIAPQVVSGKGWQGDIRQKRKDGSVFEASATAFVVIDAEGRMAGVSVIIRDVTARKRTETELLRFRQLAESSTQGMGMATLDGQITYINPALFDMLEFDALGEVRDVSFAQFYPDDLQEKLQNEVLPIVMKEGAWSGELTLVAADGERISTLENFFIIYDQDGRPQGFADAITDITEQKQSEEERARLQQEIIEAQKTALRELSTPIIPVIEGIIVMPLIGSIDTSRAREIMRTLLSGISQHRARAVIVDITGVSMVDSGVADHLNKTIQAARLKGARTIITGMSDAVAETIVDLGIDWSELDTLRDLQTGLVMAIGDLDIQLG